MFLKKWWTFSKSENYCSKSGCFFKYVIFFKIDGRFSNPWTFWSKLMNFIQTWEPHVKTHELFFRFVKFFSNLTIFLKKNYEFFPSLWTFQNHEQVSIFMKFSNFVNIFWINALFYKLVNYFQIHELFWIQKHFLNSCAFSSTYL